MSIDEWKYYFGNNLNSLLIEEKMSKKELADQLGVKLSTVCRYANGEVVPSLQHVINMTYILSCDYTDLIEFGEMIE